MTDPLAYIWELFDSPHLLLSHAEVQRWPPDVVAALMRLGFLREAPHIDHAACPSCADRHVEEVLCRPGANGGMRFFIPCPEALRVEIAADDLRRWMIDVDAVARGLSSAISPGGHCSQRVAARVWRVGAVPWQGVSREVFLARGLGWPDGGDIIPPIGGNGRAIVFVTGMAPPTQAWPELPPTVVQLSNTVQLQGGSITIALADICAMLQDTDAANEAVCAVPRTPRARNRQLRRNIRAELRSFVQDEEIRDAYLVHGDVRSTAKALDISKDKVSRALQKFGGAKAVAERRDSDSVQRTVASQRRDRKRRFASPMQPPRLE